MSYLFRSSRLAVLLEVADGQWALALACPGQPPLAIAGGACDNSGPATVRLALAFVRCVVAQWGLAVADAEGPLLAAEVLHVLPLPQAVAL